MTPEHDELNPDLLSGLRCAYLVGEQIVLAGLPTDASEVVVRTAFGEEFAAEVAGGAARISELPVGTHAVELRASEGAILAEEFVSIRAHLGDDPIIGFATSFDAESVPAVLEWLRRLRCTVVQVYDWMERYSAPLADPGSYCDPLGRPIERAALERLVHGIRQLGAVAQAYAPVCAADEEFADAHPQWRLYRNDGAPHSLGDLLQIMDPANPGWQQHWIESYGRAAGTLGFNGFHLDTYGYPRCAVDSQGRPTSADSGYVAFVHEVRAQRPRDVLSFNQVNGVPRGFTPPAKPGFRYVEVWPPNDKWRHLEGLMQRSAGCHASQGDTLAIYPPVWNGAREAALNTAVLSEAVATTLGISTLIWGDNAGVLCHPYYVDHEQLGAEELKRVLAWHRFGLRCKDLFMRNADTSWYELDDENAAVSVSWAGTVSPEPTGGSLFVRVLPSDDSVVISLLDLSGSTDGSWMSATAPGSCTQADISVLVDSPERWRAHAAVLGRGAGTFEPLETSLGSHREGRSMLCRVSIIDGWSVLRLDRAIVDDDAPAVGEPSPTTGIRGRRPQRRTTWHRSA